MAIFCIKEDSQLSVGKIFVGEATCATPLSAFIPTLLAIAPWFSFEKLFLPNLSLCGLVRANIQA